MKCGAKIQKRTSSGRAKATREARRRAGVWFWCRRKCKSSQQIANSILKIMQSALRCFKEIGNGKYSNHLFDSDHEKVLMASPPYVRSLRKQ